MLSRQRAEEIFSKVLKYSTADETEAIISSAVYSLTRFANNIIHQNVAEEGVSLSVRAVVDRRTARASTNKFDEVSIRQVCESAMALARLQLPDPELLRMPSAQMFRGVDRSYGETAALTPQARAEFLRTTSFGVLLVGVTVAGMLARYFWELFQSGRSVADADPSLLMMPLAVSLMVFYPLWTMVSGATRGFFLIVAAFQNGFFWQTLFSGLRPFP